LTFFYGRNYYETVFKIDEIDFSSIYLLALASSIKLNFGDKQ